MRRASVVLCVSALLAGCAHLPAAPKPACNIAASAPVEPEPQPPALTPEQRTAADVALITALGEPLGVALIRWTDVEHPAWGRRQAARVTAVRAACP